MISFSALYSKTWKTLTGDMMTFWIIIATLLCIQGVSLVPTMVQIYDTVFAMGWIESYPLMFMGGFLLFTAITTIVGLCLNYGITTSLALRVYNKKVTLNAILAKGNFWQYILTQLLLFALIIAVYLASLIVLCLVVLMIFGLSVVVMIPLTLIDNATLNITMAIIGSIIGIMMLCMFFVASIVAVIWLYTFMIFLEPAFFLGGKRYFDVVIEAYHTMRGRVLTTFAKILPLFSVLVLMGIVMAYGMHILNSALTGTSDLTLSKETIFIAQILLYSLTTFFITIPMVVFTKTLALQLYHEYTHKASNAGHITEPHHV